MGSQASSQNHSGETIRLDLSSQELISFDGVYSELVDFARQGQPGGPDLAKLCISELDLSNNMFTKFMEQDLQEVDPKLLLRSVRSLNLLDNLHFEDLQASIE